jgi:hypothetical protein
MVKPSHAAGIDQLYQRPLDEFTAARNALAKESGDASIKKLEKPNLAAWTVNQLYWRERGVYDAVIEAADEMRKAYKQMLAGKTADVRKAEDAHKRALQDARNAARRLLDEGGHPNPDAVMMAVAETLDALPGEEPPGRLTKPLRRMGFNVLEGVPITARATPFKPRTEPAKAAVEQTARERRASEAEEREREMTRERLRFAEAAEREAEAALDRARRAVERAERTRERVERELKDAVDGETKARKDEHASEAAHRKAAAERERLSKKLGR